MHTEATRRARLARRVIQSTSAGSSAAPLTPCPPATISVSTGSSTAGSDEAEKTSPAVATTSASGAITRAS